MSGDMTSRANGVSGATNFLRTQGNFLTYLPSLSPVPYTPSYPTYPFSPSSTPAYSPPERRKQVPIRVHCAGILDVQGSFIITLTPNEPVGTHQIKESLNTFVLAKFHEAGYASKHDFFTVQTVKGKWRDGRERVLATDDEVLLENLVISGGALDVAITIGILTRRNQERVEAQRLADVGRREESVVSGEDDPEGNATPRAEERNTFWSSGVPAQLGSMVPKSTS